MLSAITEELSQVVRKLSTTMIHLGDLFIPNEYNIDVTSKKYATEKYRIQHCLGKMKFMQIPNAKTRALEIENGSSSSIPMLVIETICFTQKNLSLKITQKWIICVTIHKNGL